MPDGESMNGKTGRMEYLFSPRGLEALNGVHPRDALYCFDFDGTLAPIVDEPSRAGMTAVDLDSLERLASVARVAILSGRSVTDLRQRIPFPVGYLLGNHGMEGLSESEPSPGERVTLELLRQALERRIEAHGLSGAWVEDKGLSLSFHYRGVPDARRALEATHEVLGEFKSSFRLIPGKCVANFVPAVSIGKGVALQRLLERTGAGQALFVGDDDTDEDVFALNDPRVLGVRVGLTDSSGAEYYLKEQAEVTQLLGRILTRSLASVSNPTE